VGLAALLLVVAGGSFGVWSTLSGRRVTAEGPEARRLAVLYFKDLSRDSSLGPLADGLTEELIRTLSTASSLTVISRSGVERFRDGAVSPDSVSKVLRVGYLVRGDVEPDGDRVRVNVRLDDGTGVNLKRASFTGTAVNQLALRDTIAVVASDLIRQQMGEELNLKEQSVRTASKDAWLLLQRGEQAWKNAEAAQGRGDTAVVRENFNAADSLFALAWQADRKWPEPETRRAALAYRRGRLAGRDPAAIAPWVALGVAHADSALAIDQDYADALEARGFNRYFGWISNIEADAGRKAATLKAARADLERATTLNPRQAGAHAMLASLYYQVDDASLSDALIAATRAYEADEFLSNANVVLNRLFTTNYDLGNFDKAAQWCATARQRFPKDMRFTRCRLYLLTTRTEQPNIAAAWAFADSARALAAPNDTLNRLTSNMLVAAVIARAAKTGPPALADSARRLVRASVGDAQIDSPRELALFGAFVHTLLGDAEEAIRLLKVHLAASPGRLQSMRNDPGWWFKDLEREPRFRQLLGLN
jgi:serine/threonine-protein kinase